MSVVHGRYLEEPDYKNDPLAKLMTRCGHELTKQDHVKLILSWYELSASSLTADLSAKKTRVMIFCLYILGEKVTERLLDHLNNNHSYLVFIELEIIVERLPAAFKQGYKGLFKTLKEEFNASENQISETL